MLCILYVNAVGMLLGLAALLLERALPVTSSRRWVWCIVIPISIVLPGFYRANHMVSVAEMAKQAAPLSNALGTASLSVLEPGLWARIATYDTTINRVWLTASGLLLLWGLANALRVSYVVAQSRARSDVGGSEIVDGLPVVVTDAMGPATVGFWHSRVLVPRWVLGLPPAQRQYVLSHEEEHRAAHDGRLLFVASLTLLLMPWNLAMWWQLRRLYLAVEMDCDNRVVNRLGNAPVYGELLIRIAEAMSRGPRLRLQPAFLGGMGSLEQRLTVLLAPTPLRNVQRYLLPALALGLVIIVLFMPHPVLERGMHTHAVAR